MTKRHAAVLIGLVTLLLSGCSNHYVIATNEGQMLLTQNKPTLDKETGLLSYIDEDGNIRQINNETVSQIVAR